MLHSIRSIPLKIWILSVLLWAISGFMEFYGGTHSQELWFLNVISIILFSYYAGLKGGLLITSLLTVFHIGEEYMKHSDGRFFPETFGVLLATTVISFLIAASIGLLVEKLKENKTALHEIFDNIEIALWSMDYESKLVQSSKGFERILGMEGFVDFHMDQLRSFIHPNDRDRVPHIRSKIILGLPSRDELRIVCPDGMTKWVESYITPVKDTNTREIVRLNGVISDITDRKEAEETVRKMAYYDALTGLPNKQSFQETIQEKIRTNDGNAIAVMMIDFDNFKEVNDTLGHDWGDLLLIQAAERMKGCLKEGDLLSRQGGDEFIALLHVTNESEAEEVAIHILNRFSKPYDINGHVIPITISIGISLYPKDGVDPVNLLKQADTAMYIAKANGKDDYQFYSEQLDHDRQRRITLEKGLLTALQDKQFTLHFQPQVDLRTGSIIGMEALLRWQHPELGNIPPSEFIPIAEENGMIIPIGAWVAETAARQNKAWQERGYPKIPIAVNVSVKQLQNRQCLDCLKDILERTALDPKYLELEITESTMHDLDQSRMIMDEIKKMGIRIAIDDFGTGYSSLNVLKSLTMDAIKIDRSFINQVKGDSGSETILKMIIELSENLESTVIAEGIEEEDQIKMLTKHHCYLGQGFYFSKPLPADEMEKALIHTVSTS